MDNERMIILAPGQPPQFIGSWTVGDVLSISDSLANWARNLTVTGSLPLPAGKDENHSAPADVEAVNGSGPGS